MKLEVDLNDKAQLLRMESELMRSLDLVKAALRQHESTPAPVAATPWNADTIVAAAVNSQPEQFNGSDIYTPMLAQGISREVIKGALARLIASNVIRVHVAGKGRRPTVYQKIKR